MDLDRSGVPLPELRGETGGPRDWSPEEEQHYDQMSKYMKGLPGAQGRDPVSQAETDYMIGGMKRDDEGRLKPEFKRDWKQVLGNVLHGIG